MSWLRAAPLAILATSLLSAGCGTPQPLSLSGQTMGTTYHVKLTAEAASVDLPALQQEIDALLETINDQMSTWRAESELSRFNASTAGQWFEVSSETAEVVSAALEMNERTEGGFDVTVGPILGLWHFGAGAEAGTSFAPPEDDALAATGELVGSDKLSVRLNPPALQKAVEGLEVDLSAIAKGYAVDAVAELLVERGIGGFLVEIGGEVRTAGLRPDGQWWQVGIEEPQAGERTVKSIVLLSDAAMATSGDYRNFFEFGGKRYSHIIDPVTGRPVDHSLVSVTVVADTCLEADALATGLLVLGPERGYNWAESNGIIAMFIERRGDGLRGLPTSEWVLEVDAQYKTN